MAKASSSKSADASERRLTLADLKPAAGAMEKKKRVGRGRGSGHGKTSTRGHNGEGQRSGRSRKVGFEGGQMPLFRRLPRIDGFKQINRKKWAILNIKDLQRFLDQGLTQVTLDVLIEQRVFNPLRHEGVRLLGHGELSKAITVEAHHVTASAKEKLEGAGGKVVVVPYTQPTKDAV